MKSVFPGFVVVSFVVFCWSDFCPAALLIDDYSTGSITVARTGAVPAQEVQTGLDTDRVVGGAIL